MNHLDNILKRHRPAEDQERKAVQTYYDDIQTEARHIQELMQSPGWHHFVAVQGDTELTIMSALELCNDPTTMARLTGMLLATRSNRTWAEDRLKALEAILAEAHDT
jgi:hypothetical protein